MLSLSGPGRTDEGTDAAPAFIAACPESFGTPTPLTRISPTACTPLTSLQCFGNDLDTSNVSVAGTQYFKVSIFGRLRFTKGPPSGPERFLKKTRCG